MPKILGHGLFIALVLAVSTGCAGLARQAPPQVVSLEPVPSLDAAMSTHDARPIVFSPDELWSLSVLSGKTGRHLLLSDWADDRHYELLDFPTHQLAAIFWETDDRARLRNVCRDVHFLDIARSGEQGEPPTVQMRVRYDRPGASACLEG